MYLIVCINREPVGINEFWGPQLLDPLLYTVPLKTLVPIKPSPASGADVPWVIKFDVLPKV